MSKKKYESVTGGVPVWGGYVMAVVQLPLDINNPKGTKIYDVKVERVSSVEDIVKNDFTIARINKKYNFNSNKRLGEEYKYGTLLTEEEETLAILKDSYARELAKLEEDITILRQYHDLAMARESLNLTDSPAAHIITDREDIDLEIIVDDED